MHLLQVISSALDISTARLLISSIKVLHSKYLSRIDLEFKLERYRFVYKKDFRKEKFFKKKEINLRMPI